MRALTVLVGIILIPNLTYKFLLFNFVTWNVGQGSWATFITPETCYHFDMGGEVFPKHVISLCKTRNNPIYLTHLDWDHINFISRFAKQVRSVCIEYPKKLIRSLENYKSCQSNPRWIRTVFSGEANQGKNGGSIVYQVGDSVIVAGDSLMRQEKLWAPKIRKPINLLILGHHGSRTSTSMLLLKKSQPKMAIASSRKMRYGHPHKMVEDKLKKQRVPVLKTETLGSLYFRLRINY